MATSKTVQILEITRVAPSSDSPKSSNEFSFPLTFFDTYCFKYPPVQCVYFYELQESTSTLSYFNSEILPRLKHSLSRALAYYLPVAGNLIWPSNSAKPFILYTPNDGTSLTVAQSNADNFEILASSEMHKENELHPLVPRLISSDEKSEIASMQITLFPGKGFSIGTTHQHVAYDGRSASMFGKSWAYFCMHEKSCDLPTELIPCLDRSLINDPDGLDISLLNQWLAMSAGQEDIRTLKIDTGHKIEAISDEIVRAIFEFSGKDVKKLKEKALSELGTTVGKQHLSSFVITLAYTATCMVKSKGGKGDRLVVIEFGVDCRTRLDPPLPLNYFGGCILSYVCSSKAKNFMDENGFAFAVDLVSDMVNSIRMGVVEGSEKQVSKVDIPSSPGLQVISVGGYPKFNLYRTDYGWGTIKKMAMLLTKRDDETVFMTESKDGAGGVEVGLAMPKSEMETFASLFSHGIRNL